MDAILHAATTPAFDAVAALVTLAVSLAIAAAAFARAPGDSRARVFLTLTVSGAVAYLFVVLQWVAPHSALRGGIIALTTAGFCVNCAATLHFTQVFPSRRPWIRDHRGWMIAGYLVPPLPAAAAAWFVGGIVAQISAGADAGAGGLGAVSDAGPIVVVLLLGLPLFLAVGFVFPLAALMSLVNSWREAKQTGREAARVTTGWMLVSQLAGGLLAILVLPLLALVGVTELWLNAVSVLLYGSALLMPGAFALAVWRYQMLSTSA
jgi:hypothetical protein